MDEDRVPAWEWARFLPQDRSPGPHWSHHWLIYIISSSMWCYIRSTIAFLHDDGKNLVTYSPRFCHHCCLTWRMFPITDKKKKVKMDDGPANADGQRRCSACPAPQLPHSFTQSWYSHSFCASKSLFAADEDWGWAPAGKVQPSSN